MEPITKTTIVMQNELWQALRSLVPNLPAAPGKAVLHITKHHALLEWEEWHNEGHKRFPVAKNRQWTTELATEVLAEGIMTAIGAIHGWQELRITLRDTELYSPVEIEGRALWATDISTPVHVHDKAYESVYTANFPQYRWICRTCKETGADTIDIKGAIEGAEYATLMQQPTP